MHSHITEFYLFSRKFIDLALEHIKSIFISASLNAAAPFKSEKEKENDTSGR